MTDSVKNKGDKVVVDRASHALCGRTGTVTERFDWSEHPAASVFCLVEMDVVPPCTFEICIREDELMRLPKTCAHTYIDWVSCLRDSETTTIGVCKQCNLEFEGFYDADEARRVAEIKRKGQYDE